MAIAFNKIKKILSMDDTMPFGRYQGTPICEIVAWRPTYIIWLSKNSDIFFITEEVLNQAYKNREALKEPYPSRGYHYADDYDYEDTIQWDSNLFH